MDTVGDTTAGEALESARQARALGASLAARPGWYYPALGLSMGLALASLSVDRAGVGMAIGLVVAPSLLEMYARLQTGAAPIQDYTGPAFRRLTLTYAAATGALFAVGITLEEFVGWTGAAAICGVGVLLATTVAGRRLDARRVAVQSQIHRP